MKKALSVLLILSIILLTGCSSGITPQPEPKEPTGFVEMNIEQDYLKNAYSVQSNGSTIMFMTNLYVDKDYKPVYPKSEEEIAECIDASYIFVYDAKKQELLTKKLIEDCPLNDIWGCEPGENGTIILYDDHEGKSAVYDKDMNFLELKDRKKIDCRREAKKSPFFSDGSTTANPGYARYDGMGSNHYVYFLSEPETLYFRPAEFGFYISDFLESDRLILNELSSKDNKSITYTVDDYANKTEINRASISVTPGYESISPYTHNIGDTYACVIAGSYNMSDPDNESSVKAYCWNYRLEPENKEIPVSTMSYDDLKADNDKIISSIREDYNVDVHINEDYDLIAESVKTGKTTEYIKLREGLLSLRDFLDSLPDGMVKEIYTGFYDGASDIDGIRIDVVEKITIDAGAFAMSNAEPMELCFTPDSLCKIDIAHEFMHLFDYRIDGYIRESDKYYAGLYDEWHSLNEGFEGTNENDDYIFRYDETQFISEYSSKNDVEDRAEIFSRLYANAEYDVPQLENEAIRNKAEKLCTLIREAFPSCTNAENLLWEKPLKSQ